MKSIVEPLVKFLRATMSGSSLLLISTVVALIWANSDYAAGYFELWQTTIGIRIGAFELSNSLHHWINDALMAVFFFVVGLEIKREFLVGELASFRLAVFPMIAALGGMVVPALIYLGFNWNGPGEAGWGIPMATDIAFALGCLMVLGNRIPLALKVFLLALAVFDDIGSILVIAVFYTQEISITSLLIALVTLGIAVGLNLSGVRKTLPYALLGIGLWFAFSQSGVHATVAGILLAFTIPARSRMHRREFAEKVNNVLDEFPQSGRKIMYVEERERKSLAQVNYYINEIKTPLQRMEDALHPVAVIGIIPLFALANAGVRFTGGAGPDLTNPVTLGVILGLVFGKQIGITLFAWLAVKLQIAALPENVALKQIYGVSCIAGIGYTMSLFIANLAFPEQQLVDAAKIGILFASVIAAGLGIAVLARQKSRPNT